MIAVQMAANPFVGVVTLHAELAAWDAKFHAQEAAVCPAKWQLRGRFIEEVFAPLLSKVHGRQMALVESAAKKANESAVRQAGIVAIYQAQLAEAKQATMTAKKAWAECGRAAAEKQELQAAAAEELQGKLEAALTRASEAEAAIAALKAWAAARGST